MTNAALSDAQVEAFIRDGFVRLDGVFSAETAAAARAIMWPDAGADPDDRATWTQPVVRLWSYDQAPFREAAGEPRLHAALDQLVGPGRWQPFHALGTIPVRFPSEDDPGDTGWHVDAGFPGENPADFLSYRINVASRGRALLMLFLFSDVGERDAPTRLRVGSHAEVTRILAPAGEAGLGFMELAGRLAAIGHLPEALAMGPAGTVYLCHPFLVHAAQRHVGSVPRFMAQPPLYPAGPPWLQGGADESRPVEAAIRRALA